MVDRLEELLALLEDEDEDEPREDAAELRAGAAVPAAPAARPEMAETAERDGMEAEMGPPAVRDGGGPQDAEPGWMADAGTVPAERREEIPGADGGPDGGGAGDGAALLEPAGPEAGASAAEELGAVMDTMTAAERGLEGLYRQTVQASRPAAQALPVEQAGRAVRAQEPGRTAALTVDELDRAVRRDSRRYDGGMTIF